MRIQLQLLQGGASWAAGHCSAGLQSLADATELWLAAPQPKLAAAVVTGWAGAAAAAGRAGLQPALEFLECAAQRAAGRGGAGLLPGHVLWLVLRDTQPQRATSLKLQFAPDTLRLDSFSLKFQ